MRAALPAVRARRAKSYRERRKLARAGTKARRQEDPRNINTGSCIIMMSE